MIVFFIRLALGGAGLGVGIGLLTSAWMGAAKWDSMTQITITFFACYVTFILAEGALELSGVLAVVSLGLVLAVTGRTSIKDHAAMHHFWEMIEYIANTLVFVLSGIIIVERGFLGADIGWDDFGLLILLYVVLNAVRAITLVVLWPAINSCTRCRGYSLNWREIVVISWAGLRGAVGLVLALVLAEADIVEAVPFSDRTGKLFLFHMAGITTLTLLVNGASTPLVVRYLGIGARSAPVAHMFAQAVKSVHGAYERKTRKLKADEFFRNTDWTLVADKVRDVFHELEEQTTEAKANAVAAGKEKDVSVRGFFAFAVQTCGGNAGRRCQRRRAALARCWVRSTECLGASCCCGEGASGACSSCADARDRWRGAPPSPSTKPAMQPVGGSPSRPTGAPVLGQVDTLELAIATGSDAVRAVGSPPLGPVKQHALPPPPVLLPQAGQLAEPTRKPLAATISARGGASAAVSAPASVDSDAIGLTIGTPVDERSIDGDLGNDTPMGQDDDDDADSAVTEDEEEDDGTEAIPERLRQSAMARPGPGGRLARLDPAAAAAAPPPLSGSTPRVSMLRHEREGSTLRGAVQRVSKQVLQPIEAMKDSKVRRTILAASRQRYLSIIKRRYMEYLEKGRIGPRAYEVLSEASAKCLDHVGRPLKEWGHVKRELTSNPLRQLGWYATCANQAFKRVEFEYEICSGFIYAHTNVITFLRMVVSDPWATDRLAVEELGMVTAARVFLEDALQEHSVTRAVQTRQAIRVLLTTVGKHAHHLHTHGEIDEKEYDKIIEAVHKGWDDPGLTNRLEIDDAQQLKEAAFFGELPQHVIDELVNGSRSRIKEYSAGAVMMKENEHASGVIIVVAGLVDLRQRDPMTPTAAGASPVTPGHFPDGDAGSMGHRGRSGSQDGLAPGESHLVSDGGSDAGDVGIRRSSSRASMHRRARAAPEGDAIVLDRHGSFAGASGSVVGRAGGRPGTIGVRGGHRTEPNLTSMIRAAAAKDSARKPSGAAAAGKAPDDSADEDAGSPLPSAPDFVLDANLRPVTISGKPVDVGRVFGRVIDTLSWGSVVGALSMLTGFRTQVTAIAKTRVRAVILRQADIYTLLKSSPVPGLPFRRVKPLETALCKMAGVLVTELNKVRGFEGLGPADIREVMAASSLLRPEALTATKISGDILVLTGRVLRPKDEERALYVATHLASYKRGRVFGVSRRAGRRGAKAPKPDAAPEESAAGEDGPRQRSVAARGFADEKDVSGGDAVAAPGRDDDIDAGTGISAAGVGASGSGKAGAAAGEADDDVEDQGVPDSIDTGEADELEQRAAAADSLNHYRLSCHASPAVGVASPLGVRSSTAPGSSRPSSLLGIRASSLVADEDAPDSPIVSPAGDQPDAAAAAPAAPGSEARSDTDSGGGGGGEATFDPQYARKQREQQRRSAPKTFTVRGERFTVTPEDFDTLSSTFTFLPHNPVIFRWFGESTRLLCIPFGLLRSKRERVAVEGRQIRRAQAAKSLRASLGHVSEASRERIVRYADAGPDGPVAVGGSAAVLASAAAASARARSRLRPSPLRVEQGSSVAPGPSTAPHRADRPPRATRAGHGVSISVGGEGSVGATPVPSDGSDFGTGSSVGYSARGHRGAKAAAEDGTVVVARRHDSMLWAADPRIIGDGTPRTGSSAGDRDDDDEADGTGGPGVLARVAGLFRGGFGRPAGDQAPVPPPTSVGSTPSGSALSTPTAGIATVPARRAASDVDLHSRALRAAAAARAPGPASGAAALSPPSDDDGSTHSPARLHGRARRLEGDTHDPLAHGMHADEHGAILPHVDSASSLASLAGPGHGEEHPVSVAWHSPEGDMHSTGDFHTADFETHRGVSHHAHVSEAAAAAAPLAALEAPAAAGGDPLAGRRQPNPHVERLRHDNAGLMRPRSKRPGRSPLGDHTF